MGLLMTTEWEEVLGIPEGDQLEESFQLSEVLPVQVNVWQKEWGVMHRLTTIRRIKGIILKLG